MTNKLPEVGKRYGHKQYSNMTIEIKYINEPCGQLVVATKSCGLKVEYIFDFFEYWEEISEQDLNRSNNTQLKDDRFANVGEKVEEAKEELKKIISVADVTTNLDNGDWYYIAEAWRDHALNLRKTAQNLLNALDAQKESNDHQISKEAPVKAFADSGCDDNDKLSNKEKRMEALRNKIDSGKVVFPQEPICECYNNIHYQNFSAELVSYLVHILEQQEQNTKRIEKLERLING